MLTSLNLMGCVKLKKLPKFVCMESLEILNLLRCKSLQEFPEICGDMHRLSMLSVGSPRIRSLLPSDCEVLGILYAFQNLIYLRILGCNKLETLPNCLFESQKLQTLKIERCENLKKIPSFIQTEFLIELKISNCPKLDTFPEIKGEMHHLKILILVSTGIREVPSSIWHLRGLECLCLEGYEDLVSPPDSLCNMMNLRHLSISRCKKPEKLPENIGGLQDLWELDASNIAISQPPPSITKLGKLGKLRFSHERQFQHSSSFILHQVSGLSSLLELDLSNRNILGGLPEDLGSLRFLWKLNVSGSNISCLPKSINKLSRLHHLNIQFCRNLNELPGELPPNLEELFVDYHLALKSMRYLVIDYLKLHRLWISECGIVSSEQVNVLLQHFRRACIQCDVHLRYSYPIYFTNQVKIPEFFDYDRFINQDKISIDLNPSWYTEKFMGFWISYGPSRLDASIKATLVCKSDPERKYSLKHYISGNSHIVYSTRNVKYPSICCTYMPFETLWDASGSKEEKNPNDYYMLELSRRHTPEKKEVCWGIRLEYEIKRSNE